MNSSLSTQFHRAVFALPLLVLGLAVAFGADSLPAAGPSHPVPPEAPAAAGLAPDPGLAMVLVAKLDCDTALRPAGALGLARMPGDIGALGRRLRCAQ